MRYLAIALGVLGLGSLIAAVHSCQRERVRPRPNSILSAHCEVSVPGIGARNVETDYLPRVVACENGSASYAALEAQAIAARSYLYYKLDTDGQIADGTGDQVYTCERPPTDDVYRAVAATSGQVLRYRGTQVAAFYVAGARQQPPACRGSDDDPTGTEDRVTYNQGRSGTDIDQTTLGWVDPRNLANRGCLSQNGSDCLSDHGWNAEQILRFYYGQDIEIVTAEGNCVLPLP